MDHTIKTEIITPNVPESDVEDDVSHFDKVMTFLYVPEIGDPITGRGPDDRIATRSNLLWLDTERPNSSQIEAYPQMMLPRTLVTEEHEKSWDAWVRFARNPENLEAKWREFFGDKVPAMTAYELWAIMKDVHDRLLQRWSDSNLPPSATDCHDPARGVYWRMGKDGRWKQYTEKQYRRLLFRQGRDNHMGPGGAPSRINSDIVAVTERQAIINEGMSGYPAGIHESEDRLYLARYGYKMIEPDYGIKPVKTLAWLLELLGEDGMNRLLDWLCHAVEALLGGRRGQSRILAIAGTANCGKSFLIREIIRLILGGRAADAAPWLLGTTDFASELGAAELLYVDDALGDGRLTTRLGVASKQKQIVTAGSKPQPLHAKGKDRYYHQVWWRHAVALNDTPEALAMLPPLDEGYRDKLILLRANDTVLSKGGDTTTAYIESMMDELPGFMAFLMSRGCLGPSDGRGPLAWQDQELVMRLLEAAPEYALAGMLMEALDYGDRSTGGKGPMINPTLGDLDRALRCACGERYSKLCGTDRVTRKYLGRLQSDGAVKARKIGGYTRWDLEKLPAWMASHDICEES